MKRENVLYKLLFVILLFTVSNISRAQGDYSKFRFGGYGEILYQRMDYSADRYSNADGAQNENRAYITLPRVVFTLDYKFRDDLILTSEIEFEYGGTGSALELEYEEAGEYEMEVEHGGEVVLEQLHITKIFNPNLSLSVGHLIVPVGQTNARHESITYFGTVRPESETSIIPLTWHETGISFNANYKKWKAQFFVVNGLDANGFSSAYWVKSGKQGLFENVKITDPAFAYRIENKSIRNLRLSSSGYIGNSTGNTQKPEKMGDLKGQVSILTGDFEFNNRKIIARGNVVWGNLSDSYEISSINKNISKNIQYQRTPVAQNALAYGVECGYAFPLKAKGSRLIPFARYEYYNSMENTAGDMLADARYKRDVATFGVNYFMTPAVAVKADYSHRRIGLGDYNHENTFGLALVYTGWFMQK